MMDKKLDGVVKILKEGGVGVMPTDTAYAITGSAFSREAVEKIYKLKERDSDKPFIIAISSVEELGLFGVEIGDKSREFLQSIWPGKVSVILPISKSKLQRFKYLHRGSRTLAFRLPEEGFLRDVLRQTGPLVVPSANIQGEGIAKNINEAKKCFGSKIDFYYNKGELGVEVSTLISLNKGEVLILRKGIIEVEE